MEPRHGLAATVRCLAALVSTNVRAAFALRGAFWLQTLLMFVNDAVYFTIWWIFFARFPSVGGWTVHDMMALHGAVAAGFGVAVVVGGGYRDLARAITEGEIDVYLSRPKPALMQALASATRASGLGDLLYGLGMLSFCGLVRPATAPVALVMGLSTATTFLSYAVLVHSLAFWAGPVNTLARQAVEFLVTVAGYPESIFGGRLRVLLYAVLPAALVGWMPVRLLRDFSWGALAAVLATTAGAAALAVLVFDRGLRRYASGSRIGPGA